MNKKVRIIIIVIVLLILGIIAKVFIKNEETINFDPLIAYETPPEGQLKTCGVIVKVEEKNVYIMPVIEKTVILEPEKNKKYEEDNEFTSYKSAEYYNYDNSKFKLK